MKLLSNLRTLSGAMPFIAVFAFCQLAWSQAPIIFAPSTSNELIGTVTRLGTNIRIPNAPITLDITPQNQTNGHFHEGPPGYPVPLHPSSTLSSSEPGSSSSNNGRTLTGYTDNDGFFHFSLSTGLVAQWEVITANSSGNSYSSVVQYAVGYPDLLNVSKPY